MSWDTSMPIMVRNAIGDFTEPFKYTDEQLGPVILVASQSVIFHTTVAYPYSIDIENISIDPDPTDAASNDTAFVYLVTLKAAAMLLKAEVRRYGQQAIAIRDGTSAIDLKRDLRALLDLANQYEKEYNSAVFNFIQNGAGFAGKAIVSPYKTLLSNIEGYFYSSRSYRY